MKYIFIINESAGRGKCQKIIPNIEAVCKKRNIEYEIRYITKEKSGADIAQEYKEQENVIYVVGGDGTLTITLPALINYYTKRSNTAVDQLEEILRENPYNKHAYKLLCQIYRDKHHENLLNSTIRRYGKTAGTVE